MDHIPRIGAVKTPFPHVVQVDDSVLVAKTLMVEQEVRHLPVKDGDTLVGVVTDRDLKRALDPSLGWARKEELFVRDVFIPDAYVIDVGEPLDGVLSHLSSQHIGSALITKNGRLVGNLHVDRRGSALCQYLRALFPSHSATRPHESTNLRELDVVAQQEGIAMATVTVSQQIDAPVEQIFTLFTDIAHAPDHVSGIKKLELMTPGPVGLRTRWIETREVMGRLDSAEMEITAFERNRMYTITHQKAGVRIDTTFRFEPQGNGTKVSIEFELDPAGLPPGLLAPLGWAIAGKVGKVLNHDLSDLKRLAE